MINRVVRDFGAEDVAQITDTYHAWRGEDHAIERRGVYEDVSGFCYSASLDDIKSHGYVLTPGRFVGAEDELDDGVPFEEKFDALKVRLEEQFVKGENLQLDIIKIINNKQVLN
jgi:type I restriction enzyme M protein